MSTPVKPVVMRFIDAPMGCRFRYKTTSPELSRTWIKLSIDGTGVVAEYSPQWMQTPNWNGQQICSFAETEDEMRTMEIEVIGCSPCRYPTKQIAVPDVAACRASIIGWMDENGVTHRQLASMCGIAAPNLNAMLRGNRNMSEAAITAIYAAMD